MEVQSKIICLHDTSWRKRHLQWKNFLLENSCISSFHTAK